MEIEEMVNQAEVVVIETQILNHHRGVELYNVLVS